MKQLLLMLCFLTIKATTLFSQATWVPNGGCGAKYIYDAGGRRIHREEFCWTDPPIQQRPADSSPNTTSEKDHFSMQIFPNPATNNCTIQCSEFVKNAIIEVADANGKLISSLPFTGLKLSISMEPLYVTLNDILQAFKHP
jgi:hypothetical protein